VRPNPDRTPPGKKDWSLLHQASGPYGQRFLCGQNYANNARRGLLHAAGMRIEILRYVDGKTSGWNGARKAIQTGVGRRVILQDLPTSQESISQPIRPALFLATTGLELVEFIRP